jgi:serine/threonine protein kinase
VRKNRIIYIYCRYNEKSDIWALGCILYEMITFKHPFEANNPASLCIKILTTQYEPIPKEYSSEMKAILSLLLEKNYLKRPSISEILNNPSKVNLYISCYQSI